MAATFGGLILTNEGKSLYTKAQTGKLLKFKKIVLGDGKLESTDSMLNFKELKNEILDCEIFNMEIVENEIVEITFVINNQNIEKGFYWCELGIIVEDPDTNEEILYCYGNAGENGEYIAGKGGADVLEKRVTIDIVVENATNISAVINKSLIFITKKEFEDAFKNDSKVIISENEPVEDCIWIEKLNT